MKRLAVRLSPTDLAFSMAVGLGLSAVLVAASWAATLVGC